ncbi:MAG: NUDIX hydrolase [candidate division Zixibacteria bacterium]|nr:NUDIX hydrolase [candidate division Zixibacteria bacterium]
MNERNRNFDEDKLTDRKNRHCGYTFCPICSTRLEEKEVDGWSRMVCPNTECDFVFYQNPIPAAGAIIVQDDKILLVKRAAPPRVGMWCIPAGFMEWGEHPTETARRELKEETGLDIKLGPFFEVYSGTDDPRTNGVMMLYLVDAIIGGELHAADDALEARFFSFDNLPKNIAFEAHIQALKDYETRFRNHL